MLLIEKVSRATIAAAIYLRRKLTGRSDDLSRFHQADLMICRGPGSGNRTFTLTSCTSFDCWAFIFFETLSMKKTRALRLLRSEDKEQCCTITRYIMNICLSSHWWTSLTRDQPLLYRTQRTRGDRRNVPGTLLTIGQGFTHYENIFIDKTIRALPLAAAIAYDIYKKSGWG